MKQDLTDAEFDELDGLLQATPEPHAPLDVLMLDGYLVGVLVQPRIVPRAEWLPGVFDLDGAELPATADAAWRERCETLIERRWQALHAAIGEDGWFDPLIVDVDREPPVSEYEPVQSPVSRALLPWAAGFHFAQERFPDLGNLEDDAVANALARIYRHLPAETDEDREVVALLDREPPVSEYEPVQSPVSRALLPWAAGFHLAQQRIADLGNLEDDAVANALARIYRHLPAETDEDREVVALLDREHPLATLDEGTEDLVLAALDLWSLTHAQRFQVTQVQRDAPKPGRNEACPCGSGKKYKHCHGRG